MMDSRTRSLQLAKRRWRRAAATSLRTGAEGDSVHAISPGPLKTRAASGIKDFDILLTQAAQRAPLGELVDIMDVGFAWPQSISISPDVFLPKKG